MAFLYILGVVVGLAAMWAAVIYIVSKEWRPALAGMREPARTASATVTAKRTEQAYDYTRLHERRFGDSDEAAQPELKTMTWLVAFECGDGETREFSVPESVYESVMQDDLGELTWRGPRFIRFSRPGDAPKYDSAYHSAVTE